MLLEDERGTINLIVPPAVYERHRLTVRTEPLVLAAGRLERHPAGGGAVNVLVDTLAPIAAPDLQLAEVKDFSPLDERELTRVRAAAPGAAGTEQGAAEDEPGAAESEDFRAVAPPVMSFASGRRR